MTGDNRKIKLTIDGQLVEVPAFKELENPAGKRVVRPTTIYDAANELYVKQPGDRNPIPILCHREYMSPVAVCRVCVVDVKVGGRQEWRQAPACFRQVEEGMEVSTYLTSPRVQQSVRVLTELLLADHPTPCKKHAETGDCELELLANHIKLPGSRFVRRPPDLPRDDSSLVIAVDHNACILCDRCIRGCSEIRENFVIGRTGKGAAARIGFDLDQPMGTSSCVSCGECMVSCPTGALTHRSFVEPEPWKEEKPRPAKVSADELAALPLFAGVSHPFLRFNEGAVVRRHFRPGDIICREGEFGSTAFLIEKGTVKIFIQAPIKHVKGRKDPRKDKVNWGPFGLVRRFSLSLVGRNQDRREEESKSRYIPIDAPVALDYDRPVATLEAGDIFGEMTCMNHYPRSATVQAAEDCTVLEILRNVLYILQRSKASRSILEQKYRERAVVSLLRSVLIFADLRADEAQFTRFIDDLRQRVELRRMNPGDVIFRQGDLADSFYLVRSGFVKVARHQLGGDHVLTYLGPGRYFGEIGLMTDIPAIQDLVVRLASSGARLDIRTATCSALDHVDLVRISKEDFLRILDQFPQVREQLVVVAREHLEDNLRAIQQVAGVPLGNFLSQGLMNAQSLLVLDLEKCTRCDECTKACADSHDGVTRLIREGLRFDKFLVASSCRSCLDPYCMVGCPVGSIRRKNSREIIIEDWCIGCGQCANNCPYGNINMHPFPTGETLRDPETGRKVAVVRQKATMCDLCAELDGQPSCVYACPHDAAHRMSGEHLLRLVESERA